MKRPQSTAIVLISVVSIYLVGCGNKFFDPTQIGRFRPTPAVNVILDSLGVAEETPPAWEGAEEPKPTDVMAYKTDYTFASGDIVRVSIFELLEEGVMFTNDYVVSETGKISIPEVGVVEVAGLSESQLKDEIKRILKPSILTKPSVTVTLLRSQQRMFSILGDGVPNAGRYPIPRYDFRLTDALATAGGPRQFNVSYIYVSRPVTGTETKLSPAEPKPTKTEKIKQPVELKEKVLDIISPRVQRRVPESKSGYENGVVVASTEMATDKELSDIAVPEGFKTLGDEGQSGKDAQGGKVDSLTQIKTEKTLESGKSPNSERIDEPINEKENGRIEWIFQDGRWIPVQVGQTGPAVKPERKKTAPFERGLKEKMPVGFGWEQIGTAGVQTRVIKIPADKLLGGDPRYNIVIKPCDSIYVPVDVIGEFYIEGNVNRQGAIPLTGRPMTLKMAIAAAGGLGPLAWPKRCEVVRRVGNKKEEIVMVDLDKIARGEQPDFFIKPNDLVNVGTHPTARWRAVLRNAFQASYGYSFTYSRNFAYKDYWGTSYNRINPLDWDKIF